MHKITKEVSSCTCQKVRKTTDLIKINFGTGLNQTWPWSRRSDHTRKHLHVVLSRYFLLYPNSSSPLSVKNRIKVGLLLKVVELLEPYSFTCYDVYQTVLTPKIRKERQKQCQMSISTKARISSAYIWQIPQAQIQSFFLCDCLKNI